MDGRQTAELADTIQGDQKIPFDPMSLSVFCHADYQAQRLIIFDDLFGDVQKAKHWLLPTAKTGIEIPDDPNYRLTLIAYRSAIAFTDIDTDMTTDDFPDWWQAKTGIVYSG